MIHNLDEPSDPFGVGVYLVSKIASQKVKVVLSGDRGDENFAGYDRFAGQRLAEYYSILPHWFRSKIMRSLIRRISESFGYKSFAQKAGWLNEMSFYSHGECYAQSMSFLRFTQEEKEKLFTDRAKSCLEERNSNLGNWLLGGYKHKYFEGVMSVSSVFWRCPASCGGGYLEIQSANCELDRSWTESAPDDSRGN